MKSGKFKIGSKAGLHIQPIQAFTDAMSEYPAEITVKYRGREYDGKSMLHLMSARIPYGGEITVECNGKSEDDMFSAASKMFEGGEM